MTARWLTTHAEFAAIAAQWDGALESMNAGSGADNPFLLSEFLQAWADEFVPPEALRVLTFWRGGDLVGGLPLYRERRRGVAMLRALGIGFAGLSEGWSHSDTQFGSACAAALGERDDWQYLNLPLSRSAWLEGGSLPLITTPAISGARAHLNANFDAYLAERPRSLQVKLGLSRRRAHAAGGWELVELQGLQAIKDLIEFQLRCNGPELYATDPVVTPQRERWSRFTRDMLERMAGCGRLQALELRIGGERAAAAFGLKLGEGFNYVLTSCDRNFSRFSPGHMMFAAIIERACALRLPYVDAFGVGEKAAGEEAGGLRRWCNEFPPQYRQRLFHPGIGGAALLQIGRLWKS
ncbi:MAG TPA: GNAT family N-acetyltransferase [Terriglobales bacterium]|nr:GNAT family N-acetyltransferase [Terriglobales bacterium]